MSEETVTFNLDIDASRVQSTVRQVEFLIYRIFSLLGRLGLPEQIDQAIAKLQRLIMTIRLVHTALIALHTARMAAGDPLAWATAGVALAGAAVTVVDTTMYELNSK